MKKAPAKSKKMPMNIAKAVKLGANAAMKADMKQDKKLMKGKKGKC